MYAGLISYTSKEASLPESYVYTHVLLHMYETLNPKP